VLYYTIWQHCSTTTR